MGNATSIRRQNTITKQNIKSAHAVLFKQGNGKEVEPKDIFKQIMDYPHLSHSRHSERFARLVVACVRKGMIDPLTIAKV